MTVDVYPLRFDPILKPRVWGGRRLKSLHKPLPPRDHIGESWELADLPPSVDDGRSTISNGTWKGRTLHEVIFDHPEVIMGEASLSPEGGFPLLLKYLDARENLSVQVHPSPAYAATHAGAYVKSEAWYVVDAEPGAMIYKDVRAGVTRDDFARAIAEGADVGELLVSVPVAPGDCHYLPSGTCHALGAGVLVAEVQTPSDTTFRVYDWGRTGRELHVDAALHCIDFDHPCPATTRGERIDADGLIAQVVAVTDHFEIERFVFEDEAPMLALESERRPEALMILKGDGYVRWSGERLAVEPGATVLIPAALEEAELELGTDGVALRIGLPPATRGMIA